MGEPVDRQKIIEELDSMPNLQVVRTPVVYQKMRDPALLRFYHYAKTKSLTDRLEIEGSSPPDLFVGRFGYPNVFVGPLVPPTQGDTMEIGTPESWVGKSISDIVDFRMQLVRGETKLKVTDVDNNKVSQMLQDLAMSKKSAYVEAEFSQKPFSRISLDDEVQPHGPSAPMKEFEVRPEGTEQRISKVFYDTDMKASDAIAYLHDKDILVSKIQKSFSVGMFGLKKNRKFVPTRWSITAVDSTISLRMLDEIKDFPSIGEYMVYYVNALDHNWVVLMSPNEWSFEVIEAWHPKTVWNPQHNFVSIYSSYEPYEGRTTYAEIAGGYYAARIAVAEKLREMKRQASVLVLREILPGYIMPVGVWNVREHMRLALRTEPRRFSSLEEALRYSFSRLGVGEKDWAANSKLIPKLKTQKRLFEYMKVGKGSGGI